MKVGDEMSGIELYEYVIEIISPTIVSSGTKLQKIDYIQRGNIIEVIDILRSLKDEKSLSLFEKSGYNLEVLHKSFEEKESDYKIKYTMEFTGTKGANISGKGIVEHIKSVGKVYIPGSSLKGAMRTALTRAANYDSKYKKYLNEKVAKLKVSQDNRKTSYEFKNIDTEIEERIFGDPKSSPFKLISISDTSFVKADKLTVSEVGVYRIPLQNTTVQPILQLYVETLPPGVKFKGKFSRKYKDLYKQNALVNEISILDKITEKIRESNDKLIEKELNAVKKNQKLKKFYEKLREINNEKNTLLLRLGFSTGYLSKVAVSDIDEQFISDLRELVRISNNRMRIGNNFPATKRFVNDDEGSPAYPLGWVKMVMWSSK